MDEITTSTEVEPIATVDSEDAEFLPVGWAEGDDIFNPDSWSGATEQGDASEKSTETTLEELLAEPQEDAPTTDEPAEDGAVSNEATPPTTEEEPAAPNKIRFKAKVDHEDRDVELDEADIPNLYQKSQVTDRVQAKLSKLSPIVEKAERLAKLMGYATPEEMLDAAGDNFSQSEVDQLVNEGVHEAVAKEIVESRHSRTLSAVPAAEADEPIDKTAELNPIQEQMKSDVSHFFDVHPELRTAKVPDEVVQATVHGGRFHVEYQRYLDKKAAAETEKLRKENNIYKQNQAAKAKAPIKGTKGSGVSGPHESEFERLFKAGFNSDSWS